MNEPTNSPSDEEPAPESTDLDLSNLDPEAQEFLKMMEAYRAAMNEGRFEDAESVSMELLARVAEHAATQGPSQEQQWADAAAECEEQADWAGAERFYRQILTQAEAEKDYTSEVRGHLYLSSLFTLLGKHQPALAAAQAAAVPARQADLAPLTAMVLEKQARCALRLQRWAEARAALAELLQIVGEEGLYQLPRARALLLRARCHLEEGAEAAAAEDLETAWQLLEPQAVMEMAAGVQSSLADWWAATARLRAYQGDQEGAVAAWEETLRRRRQIADLPHVPERAIRQSLASGLHELGRAQAALGRPYLADEAFAESRALRQALGLPPWDPSEESE
jgi:hypothetical protein